MASGVEDQIMIKRRVEAYANDPVIAVKARLTDDAEDGSKYEGLGVAIYFKWDVESMSGPQFDSVEVQLALGGPSVKLVVDEDCGKVVGSWWSAEYTDFLPDEAAEEIYEHYRDYAEATRAALG